MQKFCTENLLRHYFEWFSNKLFQKSTLMIPSGYYKLKNKFMDNQIECPYQQIDTKQVSTYWENMII